MAEINAEGNEIILRNKNTGDIAIIPKKFRKEVLDMIEENCKDCLNNFIEKLPRLKDLKK